MKILPLTGYTRQGKDEVVAQLRLMYPNTNIFRIAYADGLKEALSKILGITVDELEERLHGSNKEYNTSIRIGLDYLSRYLLKENPKWNINNVTDSIEHAKLRDPAGLIVITDTRYPIEYEYVRNVLKVPMTQVVRNTPDLETRNTPWSKHIATARIDHVLNNKGDLSVLRDNIEDLLSRISIDLGTRAI